ncbi:hypothetical protein V6N11_046576 [Hibiscus sabdariffa]|uniref:Uncharacterized protein n=2 Tax=Hibiscus sabdariffa TaxID=183260 RepID=A0ABR2P2L4_9ROSI
MSVEPVPPIFIFGDSIVDVGNNNYIRTLAKATFPNGIDFSKGSPSGRFTNEQGLGAKDFRPPYLDPNTPIDVVLKGVNYASSGSGILNHTGLIWGGRISLDEQISNFEETKATIVSTIGRRKATRLLKRQALFIVVSGSNDLFFGQDIISLPFIWPRRSYLHIMRSRFETQLRVKRLYHLGARRIIVANIPRFGCIPFERDKYPNVNGCIATFNGAVNSYNRGLKRLLMNLTKNLTGSTFVYANIYAMLRDILLSHTSYGIIPNSVFPLCENCDVDPFVFRRIRKCEPGVLSHRRSSRRSVPLFSVLDGLSRSDQVCFLGCIPSVGSEQPDRGEVHVGRWPKVHVTDEHPAVSVFSGCQSRSRRLTNVNWNFLNL